MIPTYDAAGNMTQDGTGAGTHTYQWDAEGRLKSIDNGSTATFTYNALGQFVHRYDAPYSRNVYFYRYPTGDWAFLRTDAGIAEDYFLPVAGREFALWSTYSVHSNSLGSATFLTNQTGAVTQKMLYYPWGQAWASAGTVTHVRFASMDQRQWGLDMTPNRSYHSRLYRWLSPDPLAGDVMNPQSLNRYAYVMNNPMNLTDPLGLDSGVCTDQVNPDGTHTATCNITGTIDPSAPPDLPPNPILTPANTGSSWYSCMSASPTCPNGLYATSPFIVITNTSQEGPKQSAILDAINAVRNCLPEDVDCLAFLTRAGIDPVATLTKIATRADYAHADISVGSDSTSIAAVSPAGSDQAIIFKNRGAFFGPVQGGIGPNMLKGGTARAQAFIMLHELGHNTNVLRPDAGVPDARLKNDEDIQRHCSKTVNKF